MDYKPRVVKLVKQVDKAIIHINADRSYKDNTVVAHLAVMGHGVVWYNMTRKDVSDLCEHLLHILEDLEKEES